MFKSWEDLTVLEQMACTYSDMYKDAYGVRPRSDTSNWTVEQFEEAFDGLQAVIEREMDREEQAQQEAIVRFEKLVSETIANGAKDRETAIDWLAQAENTGEDREYLCYRYGLPYNYFNV